MIYSNEEGGGAGGRKQSQREGPIVEEGGGGDLSQRAPTTTTHSSGFNILPTGRSYPEGVVGLPLAAQLPDHPLCPLLTPQDLGCGTPASQAALSKELLLGHPWWSSG